MIDISVVIIDTSKLNPIQMWKDIWSRTVTKVQINAFHKLFQSNLYTSLLFGDLVGDDEIIRATIGE